MKSSHLHFLADRYGLSIDDAGGIFSVDNCSELHETGRNIYVILKANGMNADELSESDKNKLNCLFQHLDREALLKRLDFKEPELSISKSNHWRYGKNYSESM